MKITLTRNAMLTIVGVLGVVAALGIGLMLGRGDGEQASAPAAPAAGEADAPAAAPPAGNAQPAAPQAPAPSGAQSDPAGGAAMDPVLAGGELTAEQDAAVERISIADALPKLDQEGVVWIDTRTAGEFQAGHIPGAVSYPAYEADQALNQLPEGQEIILYCA